MSLFDISLRYLCRHYRGCYQISCRRKRKRLLQTCLTSLLWLTGKRRPWRSRFFSAFIQIICSRTTFNIDLQMKPDAMNHIDQWSSGGEGSINTDPNSIKVFQHFVDEFTCSANTDSIALFSPWRIWSFSSCLFLRLGVTFRWAWISTRQSKRISRYLLVVNVQTRFLLLCIINLSSIDLLSKSSWSLQVTEASGDD